MAHFSIFIGIVLVGISFLLFVRMEQINKELKEMEELANRQQMRMESNVALKRMLLYWVEKDIHSNAVVEYLKQNSICRLAIYGMTDVGVMLYHILKDTEIEVVSGIDRSDKLLNLPIQIIKPKEFSEPVDAIVVTSIYYFSEIYDTMRQQAGDEVPILGLDEILYEIGEGI